MTEKSCSMTFLVMWCQFWYCMTMIASSIAPSSLLDQDDETKFNKTFSVIWHYRHLHQNYMMPMSSPIASLHSLGQNGWNSVQWCFWSCDTTGISVMWCKQHCQLHHSIHSVKMIKARCNMTFVALWHHWHGHQCHVMPMAFLLVPLHLLS